VTPVSVTAVSVTPPAIVMDLPTPAAEPARAPLAPAAAVQLASQAYEDRDYDRTIEIVGPLTTGGTATPNELVLYVRALANLGRLEEANGICVAALDRVRDVPELHYLHAVLVAQSGQFGESVLAARRALYLDRTMVVAQLALGAALVSNGETEAALRAFTVAERLLAAMPPEAQVPASDGEPAGRLLEMTRMQAKLARREFAA
jgi:Flp pilus assembly protein TadD